MINDQELATATPYGLHVVFIVVNNGTYGSIRIHQERTYPGRVHGSALMNPDFTVLTKAYGAFGELVERTEDFGPAFERGMKSGGLALLELRTDPEPSTRERRSPRCASARPRADHVVRKNRWLRETVSGQTAQTTCES